MSPRRAARRPEEPRPLRTDSLAITESHPDGDWVVRQITASAAVKVYRCPGCDQEIPVGVPHVVAWRSNEEGNRRHWHKPCWVARDRRRPRRG